MSLYTLDPTLYVLKKSDINTLKNEFIYFNIAFNIGRGLGPVLSVR